MAFPTPHPGLVISYAYLWAEESDQGREEGVKDRPCAIVVARRLAEGKDIITVVPSPQLRGGHECTVAEALQCEPLSAQARTPPYGPSRSRSA